MIVHASASSASSATPPPPPGRRRRSRTEYLFAFGASLALVHVVVGVALSTRPTTSTWSSSSSSSTTTSNAPIRRLLPNADEIIRKSYANTLGSLSTDRSCGPSVRFPECVASLLAEVRELSSSSSRPVGNGTKTTIEARRTTSFPWWFVTMLRDAPVRTSWHNLTIMSPPMDFCTMEKVATTQWRNVQCVLNEGKDVSKIPRPCQLDKDKLDKRRRGSTGKGGGEKVYRAVMMRDPLERFLSGYLNKCADMKNLKIEGHCEPRSIFNGSLLTLKIRDDPRQLFAAYVDSFPLKWNVHFFPQSMYCDGLFRHVREYDYVGIMGEDFHDELDRMASTFGDGPGGTELGDAIERVFRPKKDENGMNNRGTATAPVVVGGVGARGPSYDAARHPTNAPEYVREYFTPSSLRRALEYFAMDYVLLGLEVPGWAHDMLAEEVDAFE